MLKAQPVYSAEKGQGYDIVAAPKAKSNAPFFYSVKVADGNYKVTVVLGSKKKAGKTVVRAENRRLMLDEVSTRKGEFKTFSFIVNKRSPYITDKMNVKIKPREKETFTWDEKLTLEFTGAAPAVKSIKVEPAPAETTTVFLCGNSTVVDQFTEPYASWGADGYPLVRSGGGYLKPCRKRIDSRFLPCFQPSGQGAGDDEEGRLRDL